MFIIEDEYHGEHQEGQYATFAEALAELRRRAAIPWDKPPNRAPCGGWQTCGRRYNIIEFDAARPQSNLPRIAVLEISASGVLWLNDFGA
jgi:hypothetical protein